IQKQRLIKFPEELEAAGAAATTPEKADEAKRILEQIAKVNEAFGYVKKKKPEHSKLPPILDSSQYLFPKPAQHPFHQQQHHFAGSQGQTLLEPSIRAVKLAKLPPKEQLYFLPHELQLPAPSSAQEAKQLPAHFVIPVHLYKQNKEQYLREHAPQEYRVKGYKIIGDVDSFYGKAKSMLRERGKHTPKYHLFFLPRELALNEDGTHKRGGSNSTTTRKPQAHSKETRLELPHKVQTDQRKRLAACTTLQPSIGKQAEQSIKVTNAPSHLTPTLSTLPPAGGLLPNRNRLNMFRVPSVNLAEMQNQTSTAIKNAFSNIFKPFRAPQAQVDTVVATNPVVLQQAPDSSDSDIQDDYRWDDEREGGGDSDALENTSAERDSSAPAEQKHLFAHKTQQLMHTVGEVATAHQSTQKQALREGGIIIQRLKVRKGGIAIAGPGGVATAGSGGTAIVGPGGYALTHPRSLTIAGPGAKVISIPADVDLKDALQRTDVQSKSFPREGKVVATGPTVYYAPPTG
ncbi:CG11905, partial [Drosophila busckii]